MEQFKNEGQRLFRNVEGSEKDLAKKIGVGRAIIGHWRRGLRIPSDVQRKKLELLFGIPVKAWDVPAWARFYDSSPKDKLKPLEVEKKTDTLSIAKRQVKDIVESLDNDDLTDGAQAKLRDTLAKVLALQSRLERDQELREDRYVREHPSWVALKSKLVNALEPYPQAAKAVLLVLSDGDK